MKQSLIVLVVLSAALPGLTSAQSVACDNRVNNTSEKLLECVTVDGVRAHQAALQAIADANGSTRAAGTRDTLRAQHTSRTRSSQRATT
jgi:hypothetical protein